MYVAIIIVSRENTGETAILGLGEANFYNVARCGESRGKGGKAFIGASCK